MACYGFCATKVKWFLIYSKSRVILFHLIVIGGRRRYSMGVVGRSALNRYTKLARFLGGVRADLVKTGAERRLYKEETNLYSGRTPTHARRNWISRYMRKLITKSRKLLPYGV